MTVSQEDFHEVLQDLKINLQQDENEHIIQQFGINEKININSFLNILVVN